MLLDNKKNGRVGDTLRKNFTKESKLSIISGLFSIYGFQALKKELNQIKNTRLLFSNPLFLPDETPSQLIKNLCGDQFEKRFQNQLNQTHITRECVQWLRNKVKIKAVKNSGALNQNLFYIDNKESAIGISGSSDFTTSGLGYSESDDYTMNMCSFDKDSANALCEWFDSIWENPNAVSDIKDLFIEQLENIIQDRSPKFIYFLINHGKPPALPGRLPEFDICGNIRKSPEL